jgi:SAM-dependent methyltransferase
MSTLWAAGRYQALAERIAGIAAETVDTADRRVALRDTALVDLACGTGTAALAAAARGARVTGVDLTPELLAMAAEHAAAVGLSVTWVTADAADTGLPGGAFGAAVSNMGTIFIEPTRQVTELARLLKPGGVLAFSSWVRTAHNPLFDPITATFGDAPAATEYTPDQWGDGEIVNSRLAGAFDDIEIEPGMHTWEFSSLDDAVRFVCEESPIHVSIFDQIDDDQHVALRSAFEDALGRHRGADGRVAFEVPYAIVSALRAE